MDALRRVFIDALYQIQINFFRHERDHRRRTFADGHKSRVQRHIGIDLILLHAFCPETLSASSDIPVAHFIYKIIQNAGRFRYFIFIQIIVHFPDRRIQFGQQPFVHDRKLIVIQRVLRRIKVIDICIQHEKGIGIPQSSQKLTLSLLYRPAVEPVRKPGGRIDIKIPADRIRSVSCERLERIDRISFRL